MYVVSAACVKGQATLGGSKQVDGTCSFANRFMVLVCI